MTLGEDLDVAAEKARQLETSYMDTRADLVLAHDTMHIQEQRILELQDELAACQGGAVTPLLAGLLSRSSPPPAGISGWNPERKWKDLETSQGVYDFSGIAADLERNPNARLRLMCGIHSPEWVKVLSGGAVPVTSAQLPTTTGSIARYWSSASYWDRYDLLVAAIAREFPQLRALFMSGTMIIYSEPFLHQMTNTVTRDSMVGAGWTVAKDQAAQIRMMQSHEKLSPGPRNAVALNGYQSLDAQGKVVQDLTFTQQWIDEFVNTFEGGILGNNSIREDMIGQHLTPGFYKMLVDSGADLYFQTATWDRVASKGAAATTQEKHDGLTRTMDWAKEMGAHALELPGGNNLTAQEISIWDAEFKANV